MDEQALVSAAEEAVTAAYVPYSGYAVGAALATDDDTIVTGCNIEIANYSNSLHAEEVALGTAVRNGHTSFQGLAVTAGDDDGVTPCGMCRQSLAEFCEPTLPIYCVTGEDVVTYTLAELFPAPFDASNL